MKGGSPALNQAARLAGGVLPRSPHQLVLAPIRLKLRRAVTETLIGRIAKGFEFLGYHVLPEHLCVTQKTLEHFVACARRLDAQAPRAAAATARFGMVVRH